MFLLYIVHILNIIFQIIANRKEKSTLVKTSELQKQSAVNIDIFGANNYPEFFNINCVKKEGIKFGTYKDKTASWYLAKNKEIKQLKKRGYILYYLILIFDFTTWGKGGHFNFYKQEIQ